MHHNFQGPDEGQVEMVIPWLSRLVNNEDIEVVSDALWGLAYLSNTRSVEAIVHSGACRKIVHLLMNNSLVGCSSAAASAKTGADLCRRSKRQPCGLWETSWRATRR